MTRAYVGLGSNMGNRMDNLRAGLAGLLAAIPEVIVVGKSSVYNSTPVGMTDQPEFFNAVVAVETTMGPYDLLNLIHEIEIKNGRERITRWGPRTLDMDVLLFGELQQDDPAFTVPHPRLKERRFVIEPMLEIEPDLRMPDGTQLSCLLDAIGDDQVTWRTGEL